MEENQETLLAGYPTLVHSKKVEVLRGIILKLFPTNTLFSMYILSIKQDYSK
jgi:hypothetical protein